MTETGSLLDRAALDGSTWLPATVVAAATGGRAPEPAGVVVHPHWGQLEEQVATGFAALLRGGGADAVSVVVAPRGTLIPSPADGSEVVESAHALGLADAASLLARVTSVGDPPPLVLVGDPAMPYAPGPGRVLADLVASRVVPVETAPWPADPEPLDVLVRAVRDGTLPAVPSGQQQVVVSPVGDVGQAVARAVQLAGSALPSALGMVAEQTLVVAPRDGGHAGTAALRAALDAAEVPARTATASEPAEAIVLVVPAEAAGSLTRDLLVAAATHARTHLSVVHQAGPALAAAVAARPHPPRRTRLADLLSGRVPSGIPPEHPGSHGGHDGGKTEQDGER